MRTGEATSFCFLHAFGIWYDAEVSFLSECDSAGSTEVRLIIKLCGNQVSQLKNNNIYILLLDFGLDARLGNGSTPLCPGVSWNVFWTLGTISATSPL